EVRAGRVSPRYRTARGALPPAAVRGCIHTNANAAQSIFASTRVQQQAKCRFVVRTAWLAAMLASFVFACAPSVTSTRTASSPSRSRTLSSDLFGVDAGSHFGGELGSSDSRDDASTVLPIASFASREAGT